MEVVLVVVKFLLQWLPVPAVVLPDIGLSIAVGLVLQWLVGSFRAWQVVIQHLQIVVRISCGRLPCWNR